MRPRMRRERRESLRVLVHAPAAVVSLESIRVAAHRVGLIFPNFPTAHYAHVLHEVGASVGIKNICLGQSPSTRGRPIAP